MGNTCGGVAQACCSHDLNVDLNYQVEGRKDGTKISEKGWVESNFIFNQSHIFKI